MDDDFILQIQALDSDGDVAIGFWVGEPYDLMQGYRFVVSASEVEQFVRSLEADQSAIAPPARRV